MAHADGGSRLCQMLPAIEKELGEAMDNLLWSCCALAVATISMVASGTWYVSLLVG